VASATASYLVGHPNDPVAAASHGYSIAFLAAALVFAVGAVAATTMLPARRALHPEVVPTSEEAVAVTD
jgi:hypothetical protein